MLYFLPLILLLSPCCVFSGNCPVDCSCKDADSIFCFVRRSSTVPRRVPANTKNLYLFQNGITTLAQDDFTGLGELELLDLSQNELSEIPDDVFETLSKLKNLDLSSNHITHITKDSFSGMVQLERLYLHANLIQSIHLEAFDHLKNLLELKLQNNRLTSLPSLQLPKLLLLDLSYNTLPNLGYSISDTPFQTPNLEALKLASLGLTTIDEDLMASLENLHDLDVSMNQLAEVPQVLKQGFPKGLNKLNLASNPLGELKAQDFQKLVGLQELDLSGLNLQGFPQGFFLTFPKLGHLTAAENPFNCLCLLAWFPVWLKEKNVFLGRNEETRCHFPPINAGKMLSTLEYQDFGCPPSTTLLSGYPMQSTPVPLLPTTSTEATQTNAIPYAKPSKEPDASKTQHQQNLPEPPVTPSVTDYMCPPNICLNGGTCSFDPQGQMGCLCPQRTSGLYCENLEEFPEASKPLTTVPVISTMMTSEPDVISSRHVTSTSILLDLHRFIEMRPNIRGIKLTYRNLSGPDRRPMSLSLPSSYPEYTLRGLRPNCTYSVCASPLGERVNFRANNSVETGSCMEARTTGVQNTSLEPRVEPESQLNKTLIPAVAALALVLGVGVVAGAVICLRRRKWAKPDMELGPTELDPMELEGVKTCLENGGNGTLPHKQPDIDRCHTPLPAHSSQTNGSLEYEVPLMQGHCPSNNNVAALKPSYF